MSELPTRVYKTINEARTKLHWSQNSYKHLRELVKKQCIVLSEINNLQLMPLAHKTVQVYPVMIANGNGGFMNLFPQEICFLGVDTRGEGRISGADISFADFIIYICNYNDRAINYIFERAMEGNPVQFDEALEMDMSSSVVNNNYTVHNGQIINASDNASVTASSNTFESVPFQYQEEYAELVSFLKTSNDISAKSKKISDFNQKLVEAGFGAVVGQIAQYLFSLI